MRSFGVQEVVVYRAQANTKDTPLPLPPHPAPRADKPPCPTRDLIMPSVEARRAPHGEVLAHR